MSAEIINPRTMTKQELIWFCATASHVRTCQDFKLKIKEKRKALKNSKKDPKHAYKKDRKLPKSQERLLRREQKMRNFLNKVRYEPKI